MTGLNFDPCDSVGRPNRGIGVRLTRLCQRCSTSSRRTSRRIIEKHHKWDDCRYHGKQRYRSLANQNSKKMRDYWLKNEAGTLRHCDQGRSEGGTIPRGPNYYGGPETSQQCHKYFVQYRSFASERPQAPTWGSQICFLARAQCTLVMPVCDDKLFLNHDAPQHPQHKRNS